MSKLHRLIEKHNVAAAAFSFQALLDGEDESDDKKYASANRAEQKALSALCAYQCRSSEESRTKADYLLTTYTVNDTWPDDAKAVLASFLVKQRLAA